MPRRWAPSLFRAGPQPCPSACLVSSFSLDSVARDPRELWRFLTQNLSLPNSTARALLAAQVDLPEVRRVQPCPHWSALPWLWEGEACSALRQPRGPGLGTPQPEPWPSHAPGLSPALWPFACPRCGLRPPQWSGALGPPGYQLPISIGGEGTITGMGGCCLPLGGYFCLVGAEKVPWIILSSSGGREGPGSLWLAWGGGGQDDGVCLPPASPLQTLGSLRPGTVGRAAEALGASWLGLLLSLSPAPRPRSCYLPPPSWSSSHVHQAPGTWAGS